MFNKPRGCITARRDARHKTVMDYFPKEKQGELFPVGRLDKDTEGFLIVTNDGEMAHNIMMPKGEVPKTYFFWALGSLTEEKAREIESGVKIYKNRDFETSPSIIRIEKAATLREIQEFLNDGDVKLLHRRGEMAVCSGYVTVYEGKKHQVRRMLGYAGCRVVYLKRVKIADVYLDVNLPRGEYRAMSQDEINRLVLVGK